MASNTVTVDGLNETVRALKKLGVEVQDLKDAFTRIGSRATEKIRSATPVDSGRLQASVKQSKRQNSVYITAGLRKAYYAPMVHWGTSTITANPWMTRVAKAEGPRAVQELEKEFAQIVKELGLNG
jgi:HK97 gp10 family phage protein